MVKKKLFILLAFYPLLFIYFFAVLKWELFPASLAFVLFTASFLVIDLFNVKYLMYSKALASQSNNYIHQERFYIHLLTFVSMLAIFVMGAGLNIPLSHYAFSSAQLVIAAGFLFIVNEARLMYTGYRLHQASLNHQAKDTVSKISSRLAGVAGTALTHVIILYQAATALEPPHNYISLAILILVTLFGLHYAWKNVAHFNRKNEVYLESK